MNKDSCFNSNQIRYYFRYYCSNYRTTIENNLYASKGNIKKISICNTRIVFLKDEDK